MATQHFVQLNCICQKKAGQLKRLLLIVLVKPQATHHYNYMYMYMYILKYNFPCCEVLYHGVTLPHNKVVPMLYF